MLARDTDTVDYYFRGDPAMVPRLQALPPSQIALPSVVLHELCATGWRVCLRWQRSPDWKP
jgi:hypothetical protein